MKQEDKNVKSWPFKIMNACRNYAIHGLESDLKLYQTMKPWPRYIFARDKIFANLVNVILISIDKKINSKSYSQCFKTHNDIQEKCKTQ